jgi:hypothetical protein
VLVFQVVFEGMVGGGGGGGGGIHVDVPMASVHFQYSIERQLVPVGRDGIAT